MTLSADLLKQWKKQHGANIATVGKQGWVNLPRLPTGIFPIDLATGGGFPMGKFSIIYGPESSNKTNLMLGCVREGQQMFPGKKAAIIDAEHDLNIEWAEAQGVDPDRLIVLFPEYAEMAVDFVESLLYAEDIFMIGLDSIAALTKQTEIEKDASAASYGGASILVGKMTRKAVVAFNKMAQAGHVGPAFIATNQIRMKMDAGPHGNPETMPGGQAQKFAASMILRTYAKNVMDTKIHPALPVFKEGSVIVKKWKCPILAVNAEYKMQMIAANGHRPGFISDWNTVSAYMQELDYLTKGEKGGWVMSGGIYKTLAECKEQLYGDPAFLQEMKAAIIQEMLDKMKHKGDDTSAVIPEEGDDSADINTEDEVTA
jgi:recombination protein RecA